jgi:hypothetical protein
MPLNESHLEEAALEWLAELGYFCRKAKTLIPAFSLGEKGVLGHGPDMALGKFLIPD